MITYNLINKKKEIYMTQLSNEEKLRQGIKKYVGDHKGPTEDLKKGEFRSFGDLHLNDIKLPNIY